MKSLVAGIVLIIVIGFAGFFYRNVQEHTGSPAAAACTDEAKVCPDGSAVGRQGPDCAFAACAFPNVAFASAHLAFALPAGYAEAAPESGALGRYQKPAAAGAYHYAAVYDYPIPEGKTGNDVIIAHTTFSPSDEPAKDMSKFSPVIAGANTYQSVVIERFEGQIMSSYFLVRAADVLRFDLIEKDVDWTNPDLVISNLPEHKAFLKALATVQAQ